MSEKETKKLLQMLKLFLEGQVQSNPQLPTPKFLTVEETAEFLQLPVATVRQQIFKKTIPSYKVGKYRRIDLVELIRKIKGGDNNTEEEFSIA